MNKYRFPQMLSTSSQLGRFFNQSTRIAIALFLVGSISGSLALNAQAQDNPDSPDSPFGGGTFQNPDNPDSPFGGGTFQNPGDPDSPFGGTFVFDDSSFPSSGVSGRRSAGASRGQCPVVETLLTALVPTEVTTQEVSGITIESTSVWGLTTDANPTLWFYVPYELNTENTPAEFELLDEENNLIYSTTTFGEQPGQPTTPGILPIAIPDNEAQLAVGDRYRWTLQVDCQGTTPMFVEGWIERVPEIPQVADQPELTQAQIFVSAGVWFDALDTLATLRREDPANPDLLSYWQTLLDSVELNELMDQPFAEQ